MKNPQAFPGIVERDYDGGLDRGVKITKTRKVYKEGMTLRDYFAGQILASGVFNIYSGDTPEHVYKIADNMIKEREGNYDDNV